MKTKTKTQAATNFAAETARQHECIVNDESRLHPMFDVPSVAHQGDLIFVALASLPNDAKPRKNRQLAEGNTQGSRHIAERGKVFDCPREAVAAEIKRLYKVDVDPKYIGPVFVSPRKPTAEDISHEEHGSHGFPAGTICAVVIQRNLDAEERESRVVD